LKGGAVSNMSQNLREILKDFSVTFRRGRKGDMFSISGEV